MPKITIVGTTAWGMTIGVILANKGTKVDLLARTQKEAVDLHNTGLKSEGFVLNDMPANFRVIEDPREALADSKAVILAVPSQTMRDNVKRISKSLSKKTS